eukprot:m.248986 g.248986  ORF g.248986 m.248986 type:complete len:599 (+) comp19510_c0_seq6:206-2002(+)
MADSKDELQDGWYALKDASGRTFYVNDELQKTQWNKPIRVKMLQDGWVKMQTDQGRDFYVNNKLRVTQWEVPTVLPSGWEERVSDQGKVFFVDHKTKTTTYHRPPPLTLDTTSKPGPTMTDMERAVAASLITAETDRKQQEQQEKEQRRKVAALVEKKRREAQEREQERRAELLAAVDAKRKQKAAAAAAKAALEVKKREQEQSAAKRRQEEMQRQFEELQKLKDSQSAHLRQIEAQARVKQQQQQQEQQRKQQEQRRKQQEQQRKQREQQQEEEQQRQQQQHLLERQRQQQHELNQETASSTYRNNLRELFSAVRSRHQPEPSATNTVVSRPKGLQSENSTHAHTHAKADEQKSQAKAMHHHSRTADAAGAEKQRDPGARGEGQQKLLLQPHASLQTGAHQRAPRVPRPSTQKTAPQQTHRGTVVPQVPPRRPTTTRVPKEVRLTRKETTIAAPQQRSPERAHARSHKPLVGVEHQPSETSSVARGRECVARGRDPSLVLGRKGGQESVRCQARGPDTSLRPGRASLSSTERIPATGPNVASTTGPDTSLLLGATGARESRARGVSVVHRCVPMGSQRSSFGTSRIAVVGSVHAHAC